MNGERRGKNDGMAFWGGARGTPTGFILWVWGYCLFPSVVAYGVNRGLLAGTPTGFIFLGGCTERIAPIGAKA